MLIEAARGVAAESDDVGSGLMMNCLPYTVATGSDGGFVISDRPSMQHASFAYLPPGETEPGGRAPLLVSAEGGWLARDFKHVEGPDGEESVEMSFRLTREGASPPALVMRYQPGPSMPPRRLSEQEKVGRNDPCWCGSGKKLRSVMGPRNGHEAQ